MPSKIMKLVLSTTLAAGALVGTAGPAHAICYVDLVGAGYGASDSCSDYANGALVQVGRGLAQVRIYCGGLLWYNRYQGVGGTVLYSLPSSGCSATVILTARADGATDAVAYVD
ncbi:MAG TPA: hypothetical protein VNA20_16260 [Frankiaceae bacterium]|nr:hypothetical protein [Frankiaceae bacterium]